MVWDTENSYHQKMALNYMLTLKQQPQVDWKLTRGKWRPRLLSFAEQADEKQLKDAFIQAHAVLSKNKSKPPSDEAIKEAATALCDLKGIGPATASAILTAISPSIPFMSDEALVAALGSRDYTVKFMLQLTEKLRSKAKKLSAADGKKEWTARDVERCLYAEALKEKLSEKKDLQPAKKKQRKA